MLENTVNCYPFIHEDLGRKSVVYEECCFYCPAVISTEMCKKN